MTSPETGNSVVQVWPWGTEWSPITIVNTGTVMTLVYYPHRATGEIVLTYRDHPAHCCICDEDITGTEPDENSDAAQNAFIQHLKSHGRRTRKTNGYIAKRMAVAQ